MINFSAAQLVKCSASQILYRIINPKIEKNEPTEGMLKGNDFAYRLSSREGDVREVGSFLDGGGFRIYFSIDVVRDYKAIEIKMVDGEVDDWYLKSSILQACFLRELIRESKSLTTSLFALKNGETKNTVSTKGLKMRLWFGKDNYHIGNNQSVIDFYICKAREIFKSIPKKDFDRVRRWDEKYKHKEFDFLEPNYKRLGELKNIPLIV